MYACVLAYILILCVCAYACMPYVFVHPFDMDGLFPPAVHEGYTVGEDLSGL